MKLRLLFVLLFVSVLFVFPVAGEELGYISVTTTPNAGVIYIDGRYISEHSGTAQVQPGTHLIEVRSSEYFPWSDAVYVSPGETVTVHATLHFYEKSGSLGISSSMPDVDVYIDDLYYASIKSGTVTIPNLAPISHDVRVVKAGYHDYVRTVEIISDKIVGIETDQKKDNNNAGIRVGSDPSGALVFLDGNYVGKTLPNNQWLQVSNVAPGTHTLTFLKDGYDSYTQTSSYFSGNVVDVKASLKESLVPEETSVPTLTAVPTTYAPTSPTKAAFPVAAVIFGVIAGVWIFRR